LPVSNSTLASSAMVISGGAAYGSKSYGPSKRTRQASDSAARSTRRIHRLAPVEFAGDDDALVARGVAERELAQALRAARQQFHVQGFRHRGGAVAAVGGERERARAGVEGVVVRRCRVRAVALQAVGLQARGRIDVGRTGAGDGAGGRCRLGRNQRHRAGDRHGVVDRLGAEVEAQDDALRLVHRAMQDDGLVLGGVAVHVEAQRFAAASCRPTASAWVEPLGAFFAVAVMSTTPAPASNA
jgi:hypothetical protein